MARWSAALLVAALALRASAALACVDPPPAEHVPDPSIGDAVPPGVVGDVSYSIFRGNDREIAEADGCGQREVRTSCKGNASISFFVEPPAPAEPTEDAGADAALAAYDAGTVPAEHVGYVFEVVDGEAPEGLLPETPVLAGDDGSIIFHFNDGDGDSQEMISFSVTVRAVDDAGNIGEPSEPIHVFDEGSAESGCSVARGFLGSWMPSALLSLLSLMLARRASRPRASRVGSGVRSLVRRG